MKYRITTHHIAGTSGWKVLVKLTDITPRERILIDKNRMRDFSIARHKDEPDHLFGDFYNGTTNVRMIKRPSKYQADQLAQLLDYQFKHFMTFFEKNATPSKSIESREDPFNFYEEHRFRHQWVIGPHGSGKTTFLTNLINADLDKVAEGKASVVVLDSQNEDLGLYLPRLKRFARGGDLHGRLIYLEYDPAHPLAFNIFAGESAGELCDFVMKSLIGTDITAKQSVPYEYLLTAASLIPDANIYTVQELLRKGGLNLIKPHLTKLPARDREWFLTRFDDQSFATTKQEILYRLERFTSPRNIFRDMFASKTDALDLGVELQSGKVIVINTNKGRLKGGTQPFGRFFIFKILQAAEERMLLPASQRLPVYFYIDEASDYIAEDDNVAELIDKARKQFIALIIGHQREAQMSPNILSALRACFIQARLAHPPAATVMLQDSEHTSKEITVPNLKFERMDQMDRAQWQDVLDDMHRRYSYDPRAEVLPPTPPAKINRPRDIPDDDATTHR